MKEYGWDWYTYESQPTWILELAHKKLVIEGQLAAQKAEQNNAQANG